MLKRIDVLFAALFVAALYVIVILGFQLRHGASDWAAEQNLNILGDSIGGLTAPLALIFLVAAVIIQRQELILTKAELAASAQALKDQVEEQRQHREFVGRQTELMRKEAEASAENTRKAYKLSLFDKRYSMYSQVKEFANEMVKDKPDWFASYVKIADLSGQAYFLFGGKVSAWIIGVWGHVEEAYEISKELNELEKPSYNKYGETGEQTDPDYLKVAARLEAKRDEILKFLKDKVLFDVFAEYLDVSD